MMPISSSPTLHWQQSKSEIMDAASLLTDSNQQREEAALDWLARNGVIQDTEIIQAKHIAGTDSVLTTLNRIGVLNDQALAEVFSLVTGLPIVEIPSDLACITETGTLNPDFFREACCLLLSDSGQLGVVNPLDPRAEHGIEYALGVKPKISIVKAGDWARSLARIFPAQTETHPDLTDDSELGIEIGTDDRNAPIIRQVAAWLSDAADQGASDVHFDARRSHLDILYRIDGALMPVDRQPRAILSSVLARIKVIAGLDLGERNRAQDGRATIVVRGRRLDIRVSVIPTIDGEGAVIRLLDRPKNLLTLEGLGFEAEVVSALDDICSRGHGLFVVAGPTGSGKTTTLYSCLERMKGRGLKILSVEDPVEYHFDHVNQVQVSEKAGRNFASALRAFLRHDPDVILVGEIRDAETAQVAVQAALSGHLVLATLHAIDTARVRTRLEDMAIEPFRLDACLLGSLAQRLVRTLCPNCRIPVRSTESQSEIFHKYGLSSPDMLFQPGGCRDCRNEGFVGRHALAELSRAAVPLVARDTLPAKALELVANERTALSEIAGLL